MIELIAILISIFVTFRIINLSERIDVLERKINSNTDVNKVAQNVRSAETLNSAQEFSTNTQAGLYQTAQTNVPVKQNISTEPDISAKFFEWLQENWLLKIGVLLILVGFGWFISYAFIHNWVGPIGKVLIGFVCGSAMALFGTWRMNKDKIQGNLFLVLGSAIAIFTTFASYSIYGFFSPFVALALIFLISVYVSVIALQFNLQRLAIYGICIAYIAPIFVISTIQDTEMFFVYLVIASVSTIWLSVIKNWKFTNVFAIVFFAYYSITYLMSLNVTIIDGASDNFVLQIIFGMSFVYYLVSILGIIKEKSEATTHDLNVAIIDSALIIFTTFTLVSEELVSLVLAGWMILFAVGSFIAFSYTKKINIFYVYSLISILFLGIATATELDGSALVYAFIIEGVVISIAGYLITRKINVGYALSLLIAIPAILSLPSMASSKWNSGIMHDDFGILFIMGLALTALSLFYYYSEKEMSKYGDSESLQFYIPQGIVGTFYFLALIWLCSHSLFEETSTILISLVIYTIIGISSYFYGIFNENQTSKYYGGTILILVIIRLILVDVWNMELAARIVTFISIGVLFISTSFFRKHESVDKSSQEIIQK